MKNTKQTFKLIYDFISNVNDEDLLKLIKGEYELKIDKPLKNKGKDKKEKTKSKKETKGLEVDDKEIKILFESISKAQSRNEVKDILSPKKNTKDKLKLLCQLYGIKILSKYRRDEIIDLIADIVVGEKEDENLIKSIKI